MKEYLLFVGDAITDHDILVRDFIGTFLTAENAMDYYDERFDPDSWTYPSNALVAKYNNEELNILYRTKFHLSIFAQENHPFEFRRNWLSAWRHVGDTWEGKDAPVENINA